MKQANRELMAWELWSALREHRTSADSERWSNAIRDALDDACALSDQELKNVNHEMKQVRTAYRRLVRRHTAVSQALAELLTACFEAAETILPKRPKSAGQLHNIINRALEGKVNTDGSDRTG